jgi:ketosteroid isomerase-like protein
MNPTQIVDAYFEAMRAGKSGVDELLALFADDATYIEPFSGESRTHLGIDAIRDCILGSLESPPPDMTLEVDRVDVDGGTVRSEWTCRSPAFPQPMKGVDVCLVEDGKIRRLEVRFA